MDICRVREMKNAVLRRKLHVHCLTRSFACSHVSESLVIDVKQQATSWLSEKTWDAIVVGAGHNGLVAAAYLAKAGLDVAILERRHVIGGAAVTEEIVPGFKFSRASYLQSLLRPSIIRELDLYKHGLKLLPRNPSSFTPSVNGDYLLMGADAEHNRSEISKFSTKDAALYPRYEKQLEKFSAFVEPLLDTIPPEVVKGEPSKGRFQSQLSRMQAIVEIAARSACLGQEELTAFLELLLAPASKVLDKWFETDLLKATLATDAIIGSMASVHNPGSGYVLLHHVMGETNGARGIWSYVEGGMGSVSLALAQAAKAAGTTIMSNAEVEKFVLSESGDEVRGVRLIDGTCIKAKQILSNATPDVTFLKLLPQDVLPTEFQEKIKSIDYASGTTKFNLAVDTLPQFQAYRASSGAELQGTIHLGAESIEELATAHRDALNGQSSKRPLIEMTIPSVLDKTISPPGKHVINMFVQYTPYHLTGGSWADSETRECFARKCLDLVDEYAPGFSSSIIDYEMLTPPDLERVFGLTGGNIFHGSMGLDSLFLLRPVSGWSAYKTPVKGLYICGSGAHPGGGVMGAPGRNAAIVALKDKGIKLKH